MWLAEIIKKDGDNIEVRMINDGTIKAVPNRDVHPFTMEAIKTSKNSAMRKAYARAQELLKTTN